MASEPVRVAKTASEIQNPENVYFENVLMAINPPPPSSAFERWWGGVHPTFVVCWDHPETGWRAYQVLTPNIMYADEASNHPGCDKIRDTGYIHTLMFTCPVLVHVLGLCWVCDCLLQGHRLLRTGRIGLMRCCRVPEAVD